MSTLESPPETADGGYWYAVQAIQDSDDGSIYPGEITGRGWCAWYGIINGVLYAAVRTPEPVIGVTTAAVTVEQVLEAAGHIEKPYGRIEGL